ncbi:hypothetical protein BB31_15815 [Amycolatopsis lurida NRRL 2430]|uniref:Uncharacterized protein n=1 Tax=Amycolatopsis lurida NRRL 2430 TaxID=1460371 RepID=A0A2P2FU77_AMYLU|nr:hypothetical protein BB31_15815 [Amycolatopsis lurida NRRL 2430]
MSRYPGAGPGSARMTRLAKSGFASPAPLGCFRDRADRGKGAGSYLFLFRWVITVRGGDPKDTTPLDRSG